MILVRNLEGANWAMLGAPLYIGMAPVYVCVCVCVCMSVCECVCVSVCV